MVQLLEIYISLKDGYRKNPIYPCIFIKKSQSRFVSTTIYVDDLVIIETCEELSNAI